MIADATAKDFHAYSNLRLTILRAVVHTGFFWADKKEKTVKNREKCQPGFSLKLTWAQCMGLEYCTVQVPMHPHRFMQFFVCMCLKIKVVLV